MTRCRGSRCRAKYRASQYGPNEIQVRDRHGALLSALRVVTEKHQRECAMADLPPLPELRFAEVSATSRLRYVGDRFCYMETGKTASSLPLERSQPTWSEVRLTLRWREMDSNHRSREAERLKGITISIASTAVLGPGRPDENAERVSKPDTSRARAANIGLPANRRAGTAWARARRPRHDPPHRERSRPRRSGARKIPSPVARSGRRPHAERRGSEIRPRS